MKTATEIQAELTNYYGTEHYYRYSPLFPNFVLTDGAKYLAEAAECYWLMDAICSHYSSYKGRNFAVAKLVKGDDPNWLLTIEDGDYGVLATQTIEFSDFPLDEIMLYVIPQELEGGRVVQVILLTSEY